MPTYINEYLYNIKSKLLSYYFELNANLQNTKANFQHIHIKCFIFFYYIFSYNLQYIRHIIAFIFYIFSIIFKILVFVLNTNLSAYKSIIVSSNVWFRLIQVYQW